MSNVFKHAQRFSIRKYAIGAASVLLGTALLLGGPSVAADELETAPLETVQVLKEPSDAAPILPELPSTVAVETEPLAEERKEEPTVLVVETPTPDRLELAQAEPEKAEMTHEALSPSLPMLTTEETPMRSAASRLVTLASERVLSTRSYATRSADSLAPSGTYYFSATAGIKAEPKITSPDLASYSAGQSVNYDRVLESDGHQWISYVAYSGNRRYIAIKPLPKPEPVVAPTPVTTTLPGYTLTLPTLTTDGISIFSISNQVTDRSNLSYAVWSEEGGQDDLKWYSADSSGRATAAYTNHKHYGVYHIHTYSFENSVATKLAERTITIPKPAVTSTITKVSDTSFDITVSNVPLYMHDIKIPVWSETGGQDDIQWYSATKQPDNSYKLTVTTSNHKQDTGAYHAHIYGHSSLENNQLIGLGVTSGFTVTTTKPTTSFNPFAIFTRPSQPSKPEAPTLPASGTYTFTSRVSVKNEPKLSAPEQAYYTAGQSVHYDRTLEADGYNWISYVNFRGGRSYIAVSPVTSSSTGTSTVAPSAPTPSTASTSLTSPNARPDYQANAYPIGECTWGAKQAANWVNNTWGNAKDWIASAQRDGFAVGDTPVVGAVAVWPNTGRYGNILYGHVGVVTEVASNGNIRVLESNLNGKRYLADHQGLFNPTNPYTGGVVKYIYPPSR